MQKRRGNQKRKYNAVHRLRQKIGESAFPKYGKIIISAGDDDYSQIPEVKILLSEFGFVIQPIIT